MLDALRFFLACLFLVVVAFVMVSLALWILIPLAFPMLDFGYWNAAALTVVVFMVGLPAVKN